MIHLRTLCFALLAIFSSAFADDGWIEMFNGKDLTNWKVSGENPGSFQVKDGVLLVDGPRAHLFYQEDGEDAKLVNFEFEAMIKTFPKANSGVFFHTRWQESGWPSHGYEAQVNATHKDPRKTGSIYSVQDVLDDAPHKDGEWFKYHIRVEGKRILIKVNDELVNDFTEPEEPGHKTRRLGTGTIAIQAHDPDSVIHYKNIRLRKLP
ncbi:MAG: DUF1080 domain-containing protein [Luteolibacter sp.]|jgi:hypothetical protein